MHNVNEGFDCYIDVDSGSYNRVFSFFRSRNISANEIGVTPGFQITPNLYAPSINLTFETKFLPIEQSKDQNGT